MQTKHRDFAAFRAKLATAGEAGYEKREEPNPAAGLAKLGNTIDAIATGFSEFKKAQEARLDKLETKLARPGALAAPARHQAERPALIDVKTGAPVLELRAGDDFRAAYRAAGRLDDEFAELTLADWLRAVAGQKSTELARKALAVGTDSAGGHLVPSVLMPGVLDALVPASALLQAGVRIASVGGPDDGAKTYTFGAVNAIPTASWRAEAGAVAESDPTFRAVVATPRSLAFYFKVSREALADMMNAEAIFARIIAQAFAKELDRAGLLGSGTAPEPRGIKNVVGVQSVTNGANGTALGTIKWSNLLSAYQSILAADGPVPTAAIMAPRTAVGFASLADSTGQPLQRPEMLAGLRTLTSSQMPVNETVGSSSDCSSMFVGDFTRALYVMREMVSIQRLNEAFATTGQIGFLAHVRADFCVEYPSAFAVVTGIRP